MSDIKNKNRSLPPPPTPELNRDIETATADTVHKLTIKDESIELLGSITEFDAKRLSILLSLANDKELGLDFLKSYIYDELALSNSVIRKKGGIRSEQLKEIVKTPQLQIDNDGIMSKIRGRR